MLFSEYPRCHNDKYLRSYDEQEASPISQKPMSKISSEGYSSYMFYTCIDEAYGFIKGG